MTIRSSNETVAFTLTTLALGFLTAFPAAAQENEPLAPAAPAAEVIAAAPAAAPGEVAPTAPAPVTEAVAPETAEPAAEPAPPAPSEVTADAAPAMPAPAPAPAPAPSWVSPAPLPAAPAAAAVVPAVAPDAMVVTSAPAQVAQKPHELGWAGLGVRFGFTSFDLSASPWRESSRLLGESIDGTVDGLSSGRGKTTFGEELASGFHDFQASMKTITPSLHLGGDGYFFKIEAPIGFSSEFRSFGLGLYPINYGFFIPSAGLFPYFTAGLAFHRFTGEAFGEPASGGLGQARAALGMKWRAKGKIGLSLEVGYSAAIGALASDSAIEQALNKDKAPEGKKGPKPVKIGVGRTFDLTFGIEML